MTADLRSGLTSDYGVELNRARLSPLQIQVIRDTLRDSGLSESEIDDRFATIEVALLTPVATVATEVSFGDLTPLASPVSVAEVTATASPPPPPRDTATPAATDTLTPVSGDTPTAQATATASRTPRPPAPSPTSGLPPTPILLPSATPGPSPAPTASATSPAPTPPPAATDTPMPTLPPAPTATATSSASPTAAAPTAAPSASATSSAPTATPSATFTPPAAATPTATANATPTNTSGPNQPPVAVNDAGSTASGVPVAINVLANDNDPDGDPILLSGYDAVSLQGGSVSCGGATCTYTSTASFAGSDSFTYTIQDGRGGNSTATVTVTVSNSPPVVAAQRPGGNAFFASGATVKLVGTASDAQDGDLSAAIAWSSSRDGSLGTGATLAISSLSIGSHTLTASVTDSGGLTTTTAPLPVSVVAACAMSTSAIMTDAGARTAYVDVTNNSGGNIVVLDVYVSWPDANGDLVEVLFQAFTIFNTPRTPPSTIITQGQWLVGTGQRTVNAGNTERLTVRFATAAQPSSYAISMGTDSACVTSAGN